VGGLVKWGADSRRPCAAAHRCVALAVSPAWCNTPLRRRSGFSCQRDSCIGAGMRIGELAVDVPVLLAPMAAVTDLPFRTVCEEMGVGLTITEFLSAHALSAGAQKTVDKMTPSPYGRRVRVPIFGPRPRSMARAAP